MREPIPPVRRRRPAWLMPVAVAIAAILAVAGGAFVALALTGTRDVAQSEPSATPTDVATPSAMASPSAEASVAPTATPEPAPEAPPVIPNLAIAEITVDALAVWSEPNEGTIQMGELGEGSRLFVIGEPTEDAGLRWYRVAYIDGPTVSGFELGPCQLNCFPTLGYVATRASGEEASLEEVDIDCPVSPLTTDQLAGLHALERLHCYGGSEITVTGLLEAHPDGVTPSGAFLPTWLADQAPLFAGRLGIHFSPEFNGELPGPLSTVRMVGHFEDEAAPTCSIDPTRIADGPSTHYVVLYCRAAFVVTELEVLSAP